MLFTLIALELSQGYIARSYCLSNFSGYMFNDSELHEPDEKSYVFQGQHFVSALGLNLRKFI